MVGGSDRALVFVTLTKPRVQVDEVGRYKTLRRFSSLVLPLPTSWRSWSFSPHPSFPSFDLHLEFGTSSRRLTTCFTKFQSPWGSFRLPYSLRFCFNYFERLMKTWDSGNKISNNSWILRLQICHASNPRWRDNHLERMGKIYTIYITSERSLPPPKHRHLDVSKTTPPYPLVLALKLTPTFLTAVGHPSGPRFLTAVLPLPADKKTYLKKLNGIWSLKSIFFSFCMFVTPDTIGALPQLSYYLYTGFGSVQHL